MNQQEATRRLFSGVFPTGISYADRETDEGGDYKRLAFLSFATLELDVRACCDPVLERMIREDAAEIQARRGELYQVSTVGQTVMLGRLQ